MVKVSIIIPVYNVEKYIKDTLESVVNQSLKDIEIIVINDGSTDNSQLIIDDYCKKYKNIISIIKKNSGVSSARNTGIKIAKGKYIAFLDSDDILPKDSIELRYKAAIENNADIVTGGAFKFNSNREWPIKNYFLGNGYRDVVFDEKLFYTMVNWNKLFKKELIKYIEFDERLTYGEDQVFVTKSYFKAQKVYCIDSNLYYYRERESEGSLTQLIFNNPYKVLKQSKLIWEIIKDEIESNFNNITIQNDLKIRYLDRLLSCDIWPPIKQSLLSKDETLQVKSLQLLYEFIDKLEDKSVYKSGKLKWIVTVGILEHYRFLTNESKKTYVNLLRKTINKLDGESLYYLAENNGYLMKYIQKCVTKNNSIYILLFLVRRKISNLFKYIDNKFDILLLKLAFVYGKFRPISNNKVTLATNRSNKLIENLKYLNDKLAEFDDIDVKIYLKNTKLTKRTLMRMYYDFATSKFIILDDYYRPLYGYKFKKNVEVIQLWHACGAFKKFAFSSIDYQESHTEEYEKEAHSHYTKVITSDKEVNKHYSDAFRIDESNVLDFGIPRTDMFYDKDYKDYIKSMIENKYPNIIGKKVILYAPTFRGGGKDRQEFDINIDYRKIINELGKEYILILKLHPAVTKNGIDIDDKYKDNVINLSLYRDINELFLVTDILITDYSSVIFEYSLLEKPMIFFSYDLDSYLDERNFFYDYEAFVPGPIVYDNDGIVDIIKNGKLDTKKIAEFRMKFMSSCDGNSTERLVNFILDNKEK